MLVNLILKNFFSPLKMKSHVFPSIMKNVIGEQYQGNDPHAMIYMCNMQSLYIQRNVPKMGYSQPKEALLHLRIYYKMV